MQPPSRRFLLSAVALGAVAPVAVRSVLGASPEKPPEGRAAIGDLVVFCDPTLRPVMRAVGARFGATIAAPVRVLCAPAALMLGMIARETQTDVLMTLTAAQDAAAAGALIDPASRGRSWRNPLVLAARRDDAAALAAGPDLTKLPADARIGVPDKLSLYALDGPALLAALPGAPPADRMLGAADTARAARLLAEAEVRLALVHRTDVAADPALAVAASVPETVAPVPTFQAARVMGAPSPSIGGFLAFLDTAEAMRMLTDGGLERVA
jgi:hypothetical protein